jgi:hypothetical protein
MSTTAPPLPEDVINDTPVSKEPTPKFGWGSGTGLTSVIGLWIAAITAAVQAGDGWYSQGPIQSLFITAMAGALAFFGLRLPRVQGLVNKGIDAHDLVKQYMDEAEERYQELLAQFNEQTAQFNDIVKGISDAQDGLPDDIKDEVVAAPGGTPPNAEGTDTQVPPS